jgi:hypothetical protein
MSLDRWSRRRTHLTERVRVNHSNALGLLSKKGEQVDVFPCEYQVHVEVEVATRNLLFGMEDSSTLL